MKEVFDLGKLVSTKIGVIPLPIYLVLAAIVLAASVLGQLPADMIGGFAVIMVIGVLLGDLGQKIPILKNIGGPAILSIFIPSVLVFYNLLSPSAFKAVQVLMKDSNFLYLYISCLVAGSILGMDRQLLLQGFLRMFIPLLVGTLAAVAAGLLVGSLFGYSLHQTFFYMIIPIIGGGIGEGILPLSVAYSDILNVPKEAIVGQLIPAAMIGNIVAIISAGLLKRLGERRPELSGNGVLVKMGNDKELLSNQNAHQAADFSLMGAGLLLACSFFIFGGLMSKVIGIPGAIIMIFAAAVAKYFQVIPAELEKGAFQMYKFISASLTWPLMVGLGILYMPLKDVLNAITPAYVLVCAAVVLAMVSAGYFVGKLMNMYPVESAIVTGCHSGLGGTGDVAILSASNRMELMPFAQISTRIGGASMVIIATLLLKFWH